MRSTSQEYTLPEKLAFEIWVSKFWIKIKRYHADNGRFSKQPLISAIEDPNHTITFCGVVSHHQSAIVRRKVQALTLVSRTLLINTKNILARGNNYNVMSLFTEGLCKIVKCTQVG